MPTARGRKIRRVSTAWRLGRLVMQHDPALEWLHYTIHEVGAYHQIDIRLAAEMGHGGLNINEVAQQISVATVVIAVLTTHDPAVLFQAGLAWPNGRLICLIEEPGDAPFDLSGISTVLYGREALDRDGKWFEREMSDAIGAVLAAG